MKTYGNSVPKGAISDAPVRVVCVAVHERLG